MRFARRQRLEIPLRHEAEAQPVPIVADGMIATAVMGEGRNIPLLILNTSCRPDIETMVQAHRTLARPRRRDFCVVVQGESVCVSHTAIVTKGN